MFSSMALSKVLSLPNIKTILDIGCGKGNHSLEFVNHGKEVFAVDILPNPHVDKFNFYLCPFMELPPLPQVDCVWCSHVLEHQLNINLFLVKALSYLKVGGYIAITVPPMKQTIVGGHVSVWNAGLVLYNLVLAGISCRNPMVKKYDYNISVIVKKEQITLPQLNFDRGDIEKLSCFLPDKYNYQEFNGDIVSLNW